MSDTTPMMRQYRRIKQENRDAILFFRLGDFYEMFEQDAREVSGILNITLTKRHNIPMCGIPYHAASAYIGRLLKAGKKIAVCEQTALPPKGKGIAEREVVEIITPGTVLEEDYLDNRRNNYLFSFGIYGSTACFAYLDLSTGDFKATSVKKERFHEYLSLELNRLDPKEVLLQESLYDEDQVLRQIIGDRKSMVINRIPDWHFDQTDAFQRLCRQFGTANLKGFGIDQDDPLVMTTAAVLEYVGETSKTLLDHIRSMERYTDETYVGLDTATQRNLELVRNLNDGSEQYTLLEVLDYSRTSLGARRIRSRLLHPLRNMEQINSRLDALEALYRNQILLGSIRDELGGVLDLQRLATRVALQKAHAKDLLSIRNTLSSARRIPGLLQGCGNKEALPALSPEQEMTLDRLTELLSESLHEDPSILLTEGRLIAPGYHKELDRLRNARRDRKRVLDEYLERERASSGIANLRIKYNKIIGYFFEITKSNLKAVPEHFIRRQSLVGSERFTTDELIHIETEVNSAAERAIELEREVFLELREKVRTSLDELYACAEYLAEMDALASFAYAATVHGFIRPQVGGSGGIIIEEGRHPVVEKHLPPGDFIPNSLRLGGEDPPFALITGPNMAGKSTVLRQTALIVLMAQIGSFVPAARAEIGLVDRIFCRVGASDNLARGESTFLVEMNETANILRYMSNSSLVIMDEVGRGTSTNDGLSIAWAVSEYILEKKVNTLFATHYHELTSIENPGLRNLHMEVLEKEGEIIFLKRLKEGAAAGSYGIHVARLAGIPDQVIRRAAEILGGLDDGAQLTVLPPGAGEIQHDLFGADDMVIQEIKNLKIDSTTPLEALNFLARLQKTLKI
ncbi:DNA mismatch repair protein MutS [Marispirochaeta aestuarii]|uniref:DNA mismatch repair protein MutS n=1 Tax=Marispirochaeta aestuarii TaxID=1963862 RepID=A0A1Y1S2C5_9SPIO|nr:DNA mismatch repair protein MutS [Marispirochaeta aestuarii]ORC37226.1 DNA mismatch repair protein MutS [Marispirochaeta aestuarii]